MRQKSSKRLKIAALVLMLLVAGAVTVWAMRFVLSLRDPQNLAAFQAFVSSLGIGGWLLLLVFQYIQIVIAFIPGGPVQMVAGALFGTWGGMAVCFTGIVLATATVFWMVKRYGHKVISLFVGEKELMRYRFLQDSKKLEWLVFLLFLLPGTPKDVLTYLFALTPIKMSRFLVLSTIARVPAALTSVLAGDSIAEGAWLRAVVFFALLTAISVTGFFVQRKVMAVYQRRRS